jgi:hypothetical protein
MSHTPGPWTIEYETEGGEPYDDGVRIDSLEGPVAFNVIDCSAHLIAAAPEMLVVLRRVIDMANCAMDYVGVDDAHTLKRALERISKAKRECERVVEKAEGSGT